MSVERLLITAVEVLMQILDHCKPVRCPNTNTFDLNALLQASTSRQETDIDGLDLVEEEDATDELVDPDVDLSQPAQLPDMPPRPPEPRNYQHRFRKRKRDEEIQLVGHVRRPKTLSTLVPPALEAATSCRIDYIDLPATQGAYGASLPPKKKRAQVQGATEEVPAEQKMTWEEKIQSLEDRVYTLQEVKDLGVRVFPWDGVYDCSFPCSLPPLLTLYSHRNPVPFVDSDGRVFMVLAGRPIDKPGQKRPFSMACDAAYTLLEKVGQEGAFSHENLQHRRGEYPVINVGVTHGMGTLRPTYLDLSPNVDVVEEVLNNVDVQRIASYGSGTAPAGSSSHFH